MHVVRHDLAGTSIALVIALTLGCGDPSGPRVGAIVVSVETPGSSSLLDPDGYTFSIDDGAAQVLASNASMTISDLPIGDHVVQLDGLAPNCLVAGTNRRTVQVTTGTVYVSFSVNCGPKMGTVRVSTTTSGADPDIDGYALTVGNTLRSGVPVNGTFDVTNLAASEQTIGLAGVADNCTVDAPHPRTVTIGNGTIVDVAFVIRCVPAASLFISVFTSGVSRDLNGYQIQVTRDGRFVTSAQSGPDGGATIRGLSTGSYTVTLFDIAVNCDVVASNRRSVTVTAGEQTPINVDVSCEAPRVLAYVNSPAFTQADIYVATTNGNGVRLTTDPGREVDPDWSPDGSRLAFTGFAGALSDIYVIDASGANQRRLTTNGGESEPAWSPDGTKIAFTSRRTGNNDIHVMSADGTNVVRITSDNANDAAPAWSPDGSRIAFQSERGGSAGIWVMNADGSAPTRVTSNAWGDYQPTWSPDGNRIAFAGSVTPYSRGISVVNADGSGRTLLTSSYEDVRDPAWSPTGGKIAFTALTYYYGSSIEVISSEGIPYAPLGLSGNVSHPAWRR